MNLNIDPGSLSAVKYILLAKKKREMSLEQFKHYYEHHHAKLTPKLKGPPLKRYLRRYLHPQTHLDPAPGAEGHDVITELWCNSMAEMNAHTNWWAEPAIAETFAKDEHNLFDRSSMSSYMVEEHETDLTSLSSAAAAWSSNPTGSVLKSILIARRRSGMSMEEFKDYYENHHVKVVTDLNNPPVIRYFRRYLSPRPDLDPQPGGEVQSVVMEMWYRTKQEMELVEESFYKPDMIDFVIEDEGKLFDRASMKYYLAEEHESTFSTYDSDLSV